MQGKDFLYFLTDDMGRSFHVQNGIIGMSSTPTPLDFTPGEWQNIIIDSVRNQKYFALDRSFSIPLNAVEDGALILKDQYYKYSIEAKVNLVILKQKLFYDGTEYGFYYDAFYKGELDFEKFNHAGPIVTISIMEGDFPKLIRARENVTYELDMKVPENHYIRWDGILLRQKASYKIAAVNFTGRPGTHMVPIVFVNKEGEGAGVVTKSQNTEPSSTDYFIKATQRVTIQLVGTVKFRVNNNVGTVAISLVKVSNGVSTVIKNIEYNPVPKNVDITWTLNEAITLEANEQLFMRAVYLSSNDNGRMTYIDSSLTAAFAVTYETTYPKALPPLYVFQKLVEKMSDGKYTAFSQVLNDHSPFKLVPGDEIRGFENAKLKTTFSDFFLSFNSQLDLGMGLINGVVRIEPKSFFVDYTNPIQLGSVKNLKVRPDLEKFVTTIKVGLSNQSYNDVNGRQEFNTTLELSTPVTKSSRELDLVSPYRTDSYGAEFLRINLDGQTTTDNSGDNDVWIIHTENLPDGYKGDDANKPVYSLNRDLNPISTGLLERDTIFNLYLSPKNMLLRNGRYIHSLFYRMDGELLKFQTISKNRDLNIGGRAEIADVMIGSLLPQLFTPNLLSFEVPAPVDLVELLEANPVRAMAFDYLGILLMGIPVKVGINPATNEAQEYTLLSAPSNNLEELIPIFE
jgi:hypothetical protein